MPFPTAIARSNRYLINPIALRFAGMLAPFAIIEHRGRKSGRPFRTPIAAFPNGDQFLFALTYGARTEWVRNVQAAGGCTIRYRRRSIHLETPEVFNEEPGNLPLPGFVTFILRRARVRDFLRMDIAGSNVK